MSFEDNARLALYYEPPSRPCKQNYRFIGVYKMKAIRYVGTIEAIAVASCQKGKFQVIEVERGELTDAHTKRIKAAFNETRYYDLQATPHRFYLVDSFAATDARKTSPQGIMGLRYLDLSKIIASYDSHRNYTTEQLAEALNGAFWE